MRSALTIAGSDSGAGAGIQADLKTFAAHGVYGTTAITAVTAQNSLGVTRIEALPADVVTAQIEAVMSDFGAHAAKTGMLANAAIVEAVAAAVQDLEIPYLVVDPVMVASSGERLIDDDAVMAVTSELLPRAFLVTPNVAEAEVLAGIDIETDADRHEAARRIASSFGCAVLITGGHLPGSNIRDLLWRDGRFQEFQAARVRGHHTHGTGCAFSAALTAHLALGRALEEAVPMAQHYVAEAIRRAPGLGLGNGPMQHFWKGMQEPNPIDL
jgi:hydroxymethylpyrimidine/phosphomethylpyrimidine kinase